MEHMKKKHALFTVILLVGSFFLSEGAKPPIELFFKNADFRTVRISPDGNSLAMLAPFEGKMNLYTYDLDDRTPQVITGEKLDIGWYMWANNNRIVYNLDSGIAGRDEQRFAGGMFAIDKNGKNHDCLVEPAHVRGRGVYFGFLHRLDDDDDHILVSNNSRRRERPDVFKLNVNTGASKKVFNNPARINGYAVDECGVPRFGFSFNEKAYTSQYYRPVGSDEWILTVDGVEGFDVFRPVSILCDGDIGYVDSNSGRDKRALLRMNFKTGKMSSKALLEDADHDVEASAIQSYTGNGVVGFRYELDKPVQIFIEESHKRLQEIIDTALPDAFNYVSDHSDDGQKLVIYSVSNKRAPVYYLLHLDGMRLELLAKTKPWLDDYEFCGQIPISYEARDGRKIHGYLTLPKTYEPGKPVPLIVNPHGGPWARDKWGIWSWFDLEPEFYASRGFAVLKVNFRGSTGYGKDHLESSFKNMEAMHNDVIDGVFWAIEQGYADQNKVGIGGASWGGYATMVAITKNPELFQFGINIFGVVDLVEHINTYNQWGREEGYEHWLRRIGDPKIPEDKENLEEWSAINYLERIDDPVFVYHGLRDGNVDIEQSRMLRKSVV